MQKSLSQKGQATPAGMTNQKKGLEDSISIVYLCFIIASEKYERSTASSCLNDEVEPRVGLLYLCICVFVFDISSSKVRNVKKNTDGKSACSCLND